MAKSPEAFRTISEAAEEIGVPQHVLRFWETKFSFIRPMKRAGGRRFYRPQDVKVLITLRRLLHDEGYTIKGVQKLYKEQGLRRLSDPDAAVANAEALPQDDLFSPAKPSGLSADAHARLVDALSAAVDAKARLDALLRRK